MNKSTKSILRTSKLCALDFLCTLNAILSDRIGSRKPFVPLLISVGLANRQPIPCRHSALVAGKPAIRADFEYFFPALRGSACQVLARKIIDEC